LPAADKLADPYPYWRKLDTPKGENAWMRPMITELLASLDETSFRFCRRSSRSQKIKKPGA
jgi:hypothetical protein